MGPIIVLTFFLIFFVVLMGIVIYMDIKKKGFHSGIEKRKGQPVFRRRSYSESRKRFVRETRLDAVIILVTIIMVGAMVYLYDFLGWSSP